MLYCLSQRIELHESRIHPRSPWICPFNPPDPFLMLDGPLVGNHCHRDDSWTSESPPRATAEEILLTDVIFFFFFPSSFSSKLFVSKKQKQKQKLCLKLHTSVSILECCTLILTWVVFSQIACIHFFHTLKINNLIYYVHLWLFISEPMVLTV